MRNTTFKEDFNTTLANFGKFVISLLLTTLAMLTRGVTIALCNNWILVVIYKTPHLSYTQGYAISLILVIVKGYTSVKKDEPRDESKWYRKPIQAMAFNGFGIFMLWITALCI